jgi:peptidoglycan recognition protein LC
LQLLAFENNLKDIPFNFLIGGDGNAYEGRGFTHEGEIPESNSTSSFNDVGIIVAFIGTFDKQRPSETQISTFKAFLENSLGKDFVTRNFALVAQDQVTNSNLPALGLLEVLKEFDEFYEREKV